jgi:hypothetical protein
VLASGTKAVADGPGLWNPCGRMASSFSASRSAVTAHRVTADSLDLPGAFTAPQDGGSCGFWKVPPLSLAFTF